MTPAPGFSGAATGNGSPGGTLAHGKGRQDPPGQRLPLAARSTRPACPICAARASRAEPIVARRHLSRSRAQGTVRSQLTRHQLNRVGPSGDQSGHDCSPRFLTQSVLHRLRSANDMAAVWPGKKRLRPFSWKLDRSQT
jgi:hypothetical protein